MEEPSIDVVSTDLGMPESLDVGTSLSSIASSGSCQARKVIIHKARMSPGVLPDWGRLRAQTHFPGGSRHLAGV